MTWKEIARELATMIVRWALERTLNSKAPEPELPPLPAKKETEQ